LNYKVVNLLRRFRVTTTKKLAKRGPVPTLRHNEKIIQNSSNIITYLDEVFSDNLLIPDDKELAQQAMEWQKFADSEIEIYIRIICYNTLLEYPKIVISFLLLTVHGTVDLLC